MNLQPVYLGPDHLEARYAEQRARETGLSALRAKVVGQLASFRDAWAFRRSLAKAVGCSIRTVQRAITEARSEGLVGVARAKKTEVPPGKDRPIPCGWSHRWTIGRGLAYGAAMAAIAAAKAKALVRASVKPPAVKVRPTHSGRLTDLQRAELAAIDADSLAREQPPPE
jgi:DNA-binding transcriptional MocR family regulator